MTTEGCVDIYAHAVKFETARQRGCLRMFLQETAVLTRTIHHEVESHFLHSSCLWTTTISNVSSSHNSKQDLEMFTTFTGSDFYPLAVETLRAWSLSSLKILARRTVQTTGTTISKSTQYLFSNFQLNS